ncbi:MAG: Rne/Rng family ribonuclease, partial [Pseudolabrys sp.]
MADKMLIDATHPEETRVVVLRGNRVEEFDFESANRKQLRGNIYLAKVTRVEPSLQAAFVDYGGNRHGFLAFSEIHPDYYQIPVADRQALIAQEERDQRAADADADNRAGRRGRHRHRGADRHRDRDVVQSEPLATEEHANEAAGSPAGDAGLNEPAPAETFETAMPASEPVSEFAAEQQAHGAAGFSPGEDMTETASEVSEMARETIAEGEQPSAAAEGALTADATFADTGNGMAAFSGEPGENGHNGQAEDHHEEEAVESVGGADALEEVQERLPRFRRQYKIQEVIKRRQVMLVQVVKEERGTKGAALTTYLSLAGRYSVLMPNTARGGGISRKITSSEDRSRLKEIAQDLEVPEGMGVILRTAGASRTKTEVKRDFEYLLRLWETVRDLTLKSTAPKLVYEEGSLTKRSIRDLYGKDIEEIVVSGEDGFKEARDFMRMLMPSHAKHVKHYKDTQPLFTRYGIESQLDAMFSPVVQLRSGGYIVINQAEALVAIDVNSGRATREHHIEDTALKTNCEAAEEIARQLRLRDLAGLIVIDFIDMDEGRNNRTVERRLKDALKYDRARIQVGRISHFGLLEMSRQRIRTSVLESSTEKCPICGGSGHVRSVSSVSLQLLRAIEEMLIKGATHNLIVRTRAEVALYVLNHKRAHLRALEERFRITITVSADPAVTAQQSYVIDRGEQVHTPEAARILAAQQPLLISPVEDVEEEIEADEQAEEPEVASAEAAEAEVEPQPEGDREGGRKRRRRRGRGGRGRGVGPREGAQPVTQDAVAEHAIAHEDHDAGSPEEQGLGQPQPRPDGGSFGEGESHEG